MERDSKGKQVALEFSKDVPAEFKWKVGGEVLLTEDQSTYIPWRGASK